jgi:hypothetical protein
MKKQASVGVIRVWVWHKDTVLKIIIRRLDLDGWLAWYIVYWRFASIFLGGSSKFNLDG